MKKILFLITVLSISLFACKSKNNELTLPSIFSNNMVLQQDIDISIWGKATPNYKIKITGSWGENTSCKSDEYGKWQAKLKTPKAGGPYELIIRSGNVSVQYNNVLIGEVWLCSGQSNMEMPFVGLDGEDTVLNAQEEINNANYPQIRLFNVANNSSPTPLYNSQGRKFFAGTKEKIYYQACQWLECNSENIEPFSATAYFFGRKLHQELGVPIGLINATWGGTPAQAWCNKKSIGNFEEYKAMISQLENYDSNSVALDKWLAKKPSIAINMSKADKWDNIDLNDNNCSTTNYNDSKWSSINIPGYWEYTEIGNFDGVIWFRKTIDLPENFTKNDLILKLGIIDDADLTYFNGIKVGGFQDPDAWKKERVYNIPASLVKKGKNIIAVRIIDNFVKGGFRGDIDAFCMYPQGQESHSISVAGNWKYLPVAEFKNKTLYLIDAESMEYNSRPNAPTLLMRFSPTCLYNGMIAPISPYSIKGVIWYQGEDNVNSNNYQEIFTALINGWRQDWSYPEMPFYFAQIAPYDYANFSGGHSCKIRDCQRRTLSLPNTGMVVTLDIGSNKTIHPPNKQEVGRRFALIALAKLYGKDIVYSGPLYKSMLVKDNKIELSFDHTNGGLKSKNDVLEHFTICGKDKIFKEAIAEIHNDKVIVFNKYISNPIAVRYAWSNTAEASLFNGAGLPAGTFRTDDW